MQLVNFNSWSRMFGQVLRSSTLDHLYVDNVDLVNNIYHVTPIFGDDQLKVAELSIIRPL